MHELPDGVRVEQPQGRDELVLRVNGESVLMDRDGARGLAELLLARVE